MTKLNYPFQEIPEHGTAMEIAPGVRWVRMPLPMALDHINLYMLEDDDGWWIVDTGMKWGPTQEYWQTIFESECKEKPVKGVIVTHMHPDHVGQAGWICEKFRVRLYMTFSEYYSARSFSQIGKDGVSWSTEQHFRSVGFDDDQLSRFKKKFGGYGSVVEPIPSAFFRLEEGTTLNIGGRAWEVAIGSGHSPEHACLYCAELGVLLSGDQIIPRITSNVSVMPSEPEANPLKRWLVSLEKFFRFPADTLVLPAHNTPFTGLHTRLHDLIAHHEDHLLALEEACVEAKTALKLLPVLFKRKLDGPQLIIAIGECVAHLNYLMYTDKIQRTVGDNGVYYYLSIDPTLKQRARPGTHHQDDAPFEV